MIPGWQAFVSTVLMSLALLAQGGMGPGPGTPAASGGGSHVFTVVQSTTCAGTTTSTTCSFSATAAGDALLLGCHSTDTTGVDPTFTPAATTMLSRTQSTGWAQLSYIYPVTTGTTSITMTLPMFVTGGCVIAETAGTNYVADASSALTLDTAYSGSGSATNLTGAATTTNANDVCFGHLFVDATFPNAPVYTPGTGYTSIGNVLQTYAQLSTFVEYQKVTSTGTYNPGATWTTGPFNAAFGTACVKLL